MTDLVEILRETSNQLNWKFYYGRRDFNNLVEASSENDLQWHFFLDPITTEAIRNNGTQTGEFLNEGHFMILTKSNLDEVYDNQLEVNPDDGKYRKYIQPKVKGLFSDFEKKLNCLAQVEIKVLKSSEVINLFDENLDGILVQFKIGTF